jgi:hypothetical protein
MKSESTAINNTDPVNRFAIPVQALISIIKKFKNKNDNGAFFYELKARDHLFIIEALCRIYKNVLGKKIFEQLTVEVKTLEDQLGKIDFYNGYLKEFSAEKQIPGSFLRYFFTHKQEEIMKLNGIIERGNIFANEKGLNETLALLKNVKWKDREAERNDITLFMVNHIDKILKQHDNGILNFNTIEDGVHEFRRRIRWISIYALALNGLVRLKKVNNIPENLKKYLTVDILNSPFNNLHAPPKGLIPVEIQAPHFYALSWLIQETGRLKDAALKINVVNEAIRQSDIRTKKTAAILHAHLLPRSSPSMSYIFENTERIADTFIHNDMVLYHIRRDLLRSLN